MNTPRLEIYLNKEIEICFAKKESDIEVSRLILNVELNELKSFGLEGAEKRIGMTVFKIMNTLYSEDFKSWKIPSTSTIQKFETEKYDIAMQLMHLSITERISSHVPSIDILFREQKILNEEMRKFIEESWPTIKERLISFQ